MGCLCSKPDKSHAPIARNAQLNEKSPILPNEHYGTSNNRPRPPDLQLERSSTGDPDFLKHLADTKRRTPSEETYQSTSSQNSQDSNAPLIKHDKPKQKKLCLPGLPLSKSEKSNPYTSSEPADPAPRHSTESATSIRNTRTTSSVPRSQIPQKPTKSKTPPSKHLSQAELLDLYTAPHDDPSLIKAFTAGDRQLTNHTIEFYPQAGWDALKPDERDVFRKYVVGAEPFLCKKDNVKWVVMAVIAGVVWDWVEDGFFLSELGIVTGGGVGRGGRRVDRARLVQLVQDKNGSRRFETTKDTETRKLATYIHQLLAPFATKAKSREALRLRSLQSLVSKVLDIKIVMDVQNGEFQYRAHRIAVDVAQQRRFDAERMERIAGPADGGYVQGILWPALVKGFEGFGVEEGAVLAAMKVLVE